MSDVRLGKLIDTAATRDAVHVAVVPVVAKVVLIPGQRVNAEGLPLGDLIGIVDPWLPDVVLPGQRFWLCLPPGSITSLRHKWTHPAFDGAAEPDPSDRVSESRSWLERCAMALGLTYDALMSAAERWLRYEDYTTQIDSDHWRDTFYDYADEFWPHYEAVIGVKVEASKRGQFFSCSC